MFFTSANMRCLENWFEELAKGMTLQKMFYSSAPSATYMSQWIGSEPVQIMAYSPLGAKPLSQLVLGYGQMDPKEQTSVKL